METKSLEVYCEDSNYAVIKPPGRNYPGAVIQGDSLATLAKLSSQIALAAKRGQLQSRDCRHCIEELNEALVGRVLHYQGVLREHGIDYPHVHPITEDDVIRRS